MKKILLCIFLSLTLLLLSCTNNLEGQYRKTSMDGTVTIKMNPAKVATGPNQGGTGCTASGIYSINLYFPMDGGEPVKQANTMTLSSYNCSNYGTASASCVATPSESSYTPRTFELMDVNLQVDQYSPEFFGGNESGEILMFQKDATAQTEVMQLSISCNGGEPYTMDDMFTFNQLYLPFYNSSWMLPFTLGVSTDEEIKDNPMTSVNSLFLADMKWVQTEILVFSLEE